MNVDKLKFPIGKYAPIKNPNKIQLTKWIHEIGVFPSRLEKITKDLSDKQLLWKYRPGGWTIAQVVHHCADSHMNSLSRFKLTLTENTPIIRPYFEDKWAELKDGKDCEILHTIILLKGLHVKWVILLNSLTKTQLALEYEHPEHGQIFNLAETIGNYAWHCNHHLAHIQNALIVKDKY